MANKTVTIEASNGKFIGQLGSIELDEGIDSGSFRQYVEVKVEVDGKLFKQDDA